MLSLPFATACSDERQYTVIYRLSLGLFVQKNLSHVLIQLSLPGAQEPDVLPRATFRVITNPTARAVAWLLAGVVRHGRVVYNPALGLAYLGYIGRGWWRTVKIEWSG